MWFPLILFGTCLLETSGFTVYRLDTGEKHREPIKLSMVYVLNEELAIIQCPALNKLVDRSTVQLVWTRNGSEILETLEEPRIKIKNDALWFFPAVKEDSGIYNCIVRNASYFVEISMPFKVMSDTPTSLPYIKYEEIVNENTECMMTCPALPDFTKYPINMKINWYKDGELLLSGSSKYRYTDGTTYALINDVTHEDEGYYKCQLKFSLENIDYTISRIIQLRVIAQASEKKPHPVILNPDRKTIAAAIGSKLTIPCKVFAGHDKLLVWWTANDFDVNEYSKDHRVTEGMLQETTEADGQYFELPLIFERIEEEDFITDFKCIALNDYGHEVLPTQIKQAASSFAWYIAAVPTLVVFLIIAIIFITKHRKCGNKNDYSLAKS